MSLDPSADELERERQSEPPPLERPAPNALVRLFFNTLERRPRALVRLVLHFVAMAIVLRVVDALSAILPSWTVTVIDLVVIVVVTWAATRVLDRRPFVDVGMRVDGPRLLDLVAGALAGTLAIAVVVCLEVGLGVAQLELRTLDAARLSAAGIAGWFFVAVAIQEELIFRGYHVVNLAEGLTSERVPPPRAAIAAVVISSTVFGLAHAANQNATILSTFNIAVGGGFLLSAGFLLTGDLAFSIGLHFAWNLGQCLLGMPVSGFVMTRAALVAREVSGDDWLTGGAFGPEAGVIGLTGMLVGSLLAVLYARARYGPFEVRLRLRAPSQS